MLLVTKIEQAGNHKRTHPELRLHVTVPWPEEATPESLFKAPSRLIDVDAGAFGVGGLPFRAIGRLDLLALNEVDDDLLSSVLKERRDALLQSPGSWCGGDRIWVRFDREKGTPALDAHPGDDAPQGISDESILDELIGAADVRLHLRRKRVSLRLHEMMLQRFRGIQHLELSLAPTKATVLVGANGSGKTALLDAASLLLGEVVTTILNSTELSPKLTDDDIKNGEEQTVLSARASLGNEALTWNLWRRRGGYESAEEKLFSANVELGTATNRIDTRECVPLILHYPVNRAVLHVPLGIREAHRFEPIEAYDGALTEGRSDFRLFFEWFRQREDLENEFRIHDSNHRDHQLQAVRDAIHEFVPEFKNLRVQRAALRLLVNKGEQTLYVDQLSDGEKCLLALAGDIARRLATANPYADHPLHGGGVVLIDEIELHLHPAWQRRIVPALERTFPNVQFILTTHSPQVLSSVTREQIVLLSGFQVVPHLPYTEGRDSNAILSELMGVPMRPEDAGKEIDALSKLIDEEDFESARKKLSALEERFGPNDRDVLRLGALLREVEEDEA